MKKREVPNLAELELIGTQSLASLLSLFVRGNSA